MDPYSPVARAVSIALRAAHLLAMAGFVGGVQLGVDGASVAPWRLAAVLTGFLLLASELTHGGGWLSQVRGLTAVAHVAALGLLAVGEGRLATALAVVLGAAGSHAPKSVRKWSPWGRGAEADGPDHPRR